MVAFSPAILILLIIHQSSTYENEGRLHSQHRSFPSETKSAPVHFYCDKGVKLCSADFKGYYVGCYEDEVPGVQYYFQCKQGTRCGCQLNGECELEDPCIPIDTPYPMKKKATFRFNGTTKNHYYLREGAPRRSRNFIGLVKQDADEGKYLQIIDHESYLAKSFELIVPNDKGGFTKYSGFSDPVKFPCKAEEFQTFEAFGADIKNHLLTKKEEKNGNIIQTWDYMLEYEWMSWITWKWKWVVKADPVTQTATPIRTEYYADGIEGWDELAYEEKQNVTWVTGELEEPWGKKVKWYTDLWSQDDQSNDWFRVPEICKHAEDSVCWKRISPGCVRGHNIKRRYRNKTLEQCKRLCFENSRCLSFEFGVSHGGTRKVYKEGDCQLNNGVDSSRCDGRDNNLDLYIKRKC